MRCCSMFACKRSVMCASHIVIVTTAPHVRIERDLRYIIRVHHCVALHWKTRCWFQGHESNSKNLAFPEDHGMPGKQHPNHPAVATLDAQTTMNGTCQRRKQW